MLLRDIITGAMLSANGASTTDEKVTRYKLARLVTTIDQPDVKAEDIVLIKKLVGEVYAPLVVGQAVEMLD